ncbi:MAG: mercuric transporter MerT family protein [Acidobacteriota bacterium]
MREKISAVGSVISAMFASICCIGPIAVVALGVSGAGWIPFLIKFRYLFILIALLLISWAWWIIIKKDKCCEVETGARKFLTKDKIFLTLVSAIVILIILLPYILGKI